MEGASTRDLVLLRLALIGGVALFMLVIARVRGMTLSRIHSLLSRSG